MESIEKTKVESETISDFARIMNTGSNALSCSSMDKETGSGRLNIDSDNVKNGLGQLVLTLVKLLHELLERQSIRRIEAGSLSDDEIERLGVTLMKQAQEIERLRKEFNLDEDDLNLDLGPLGRLL